MKKLIPVLLMLSHDASAYFISCNAEAIDANHWIDKCNDAITATQHCNQGAAVINALTFGIGGLICAAPALVAQNFCRISHEKYNTYNHCMATQGHLIAQQHIDGVRAKCLALAQEHLMKWRNRSGNGKYDTNGMVYRATKGLIKKYIEDGLDIENEEVAEVLELELELAVKAATEKAKEFYEGWYNYEKEKVTKKCG